MTDQYRAGLRLSLATIAWTTFSSVTSVALGVQHGVISLIAFGLAGGLDAAGSVAVAVSFRHAIRFGSLDEDRERRAARIIGFGMVVIGSLTALESVRRLITGERGDDVSLGVLVAIGSVFALTALSVAKRRAGKAVNSESLIADSTISAAGAALAAIAVVGATIGTVDAVAALVIAVVTVRVGAQVASGPRTGQSPPDEQ